MTYEQKTKYMHYAMHITFFALALVLLFSVSALAVCLYDPTIHKFCFNFLATSVVICFVVWFLCLGFCEIIS